MDADPVRVFRHHYGDDAFDLIPDQEVFGMGDTGYGPGRDRINEVMTKVIGLNQSRSRDQGTRAVI